MNKCHHFQRLSPKPHEPGGRPTPVPMRNHFLPALVVVTIFMTGLPLRAAESSRETMRRIFESALEVPVSQFESLSELDFCRDYGSSPAGWRLGPFAQDNAMTFVKTRAFEDPTDIGWKSTILGNPTLIEREGALHMFYRAYPRKESLSTRIGHAVYSDKTGWTDLSGPPVLYPTESDELYSVEDPKIYQVGDTYYMFYNAVWKPDPIFSERVRQGYRDWGIFVVTKVATSKDLIHFEKKGQVIPYGVSKGWSKGAVIPRNARGEAVRIDGKFLMFVSEGCGDKQFIGYSDDLLNWQFRQQTFLSLPAEMGEVAEVACCAIQFEPTGKYFLLDAFCRDRENHYFAIQALYAVSNPAKALAIGKGGSLAWGGLLKYHDDWIVAQGWDSPKTRQEIYVYKFSGDPRVSESMP